MININRFRRFALATLFAVGVVLFTSTPVFAQSGGDVLETVFYSVDSEQSYQSFAENRGQISVVAPQIFEVDADGMVWGEVSS